MPNLVQTGLPTLPNQGAMRRTGHWLRILGSITALTAILGLSPTLVAQDDNLSLEKVDWMALPDGGIAVGAPVYFQHYLQPTSSDRRLEARWLKVQAQQLAEALHLQSKRLVELRDQQSELDRQLDQHQVSYESIPSVKRDLQVQLSQLKIELAGKEARLAAIVDEAKRREEVLARKQREVVILCQELVDHEVNQLQELTKLYERSAVSIQSVHDQEKSVVQARKQLAEAEAQQETEMGLSERLLDVSLDAAELRAQIVAIEQRLEQLSQAESTARQIRELRDLELEPTLQHVRFLSKLKQQVDARLLDVQTQVEAIQQIEDEAERPDSK